PLRTSAASHAGARRRVSRVEADHLVAPGAAHESSRCRRMKRLRYFAGAAADFREIIRAPRLHSAETVLRAQLSRRHEPFLELMRRVVFANAAHPYRQMFEIAGCGYEDLAAGVRRDGLDTTLARLHRSGVYLTHDEFKLKMPIVRGNRTIAADAGSFQNPLASGRMVGVSGGRRSAARR